MAKRKTTYHAIWQVKIIGIIFLIKAYTSVYDLFFLNKLQLQLTNQRKLSSFYRKQIFIHGGHISSNRKFPVFSLCLKYFPCITAKLPF